MALQKTLSIIKPDAVEQSAIGQIIAIFEENGLKLAGARMTTLKREEAEKFYAIHSDKPFFNDLVEYMISGPVFISILEGENAVSLNRELMGATDPRKAAPGTIRARWGKDLGANAVHGSDSEENAELEISLLFPAA
jgi:nucleoside-diphosphate kinase